MKIVVNDGEKHRLRLRFPTGLLLNRFTIPIIVKGLRQEGIRVTKEQVIGMLKAARSFKRRYPNWKILEAEGAKGEKVEIRL